MLIGQKRSFDAFSNVRHYSNIRHPLQHAPEQEYVLPYRDNESTVENYKRQISEQQTRISALENKISSLNTEIQVATHKLLHAEDNEQTISQLKNEIYSISNERDTANLRLKQEIASLKTHFQQKANEWEDLTSRTKKDHENKMMIIQNEAAILSEKLKAAMETDSQRKSDLQMRIDSLNRDKELLLQQNKTNEEHIIELRKNIENIEIKNRNLLISKDENIKALEANIYELDMRIKNMTSNLVGKNSYELQNKLSEITSLQRNLETMKEDLRRQKLENEELRRQKEAESQKLYSSEEKARELENQITVKRNEILNAQNNLNRVQNELAIVKNDLNRKDDVIQKLKNENSRNEDKIRNMEFIIEGIRNEKSMVERQIENSNYNTTVELRELQQRVQRHGEEIARLERDKNTFEQKYREEKSKTENLSLLKERLEREIQELQTLDYKKAAEMNIKLQNQLASFELDKKSKDNMILELNENLRRFQNEKDQAMIKIKDLQNKIIQKDQEISNYNNQINALNFEIEKLKTELNGFRNKVNYVEREMQQKMIEIITSFKGILELNNGLESASLSNIIQDMQMAMNSNNLTLFMANVAIANTNIKYMFIDNKKSIVENQNNQILINQLNNEIKNLFAKLEDANALKLKYEKNNEDKQVQLQAIATQENRNKQDIYTYQTQINEYEKKLYETTQKNNLLENQILESKKSLQQTTENLLMVQKNMEVLQSEKQLLGAKIQELSQIQPANVNFAAYGQKPVSFGAFEYDANDYPIIQEEKADNIYSEDPNAYDLNQTQRAGFKDIERKRAGWQEIHKRAGWKEKYQRAGYKYIDQPTNPESQRAGFREAEKVAPEQPFIFRDREDLKAAEDFMVNNSTTRYYKPSLRFFFLFFSDKVPEEDRELNVAEEISPTVSYWIDQFKLINTDVEVSNVNRYQYKFKIANADVLMINNVRDALNLVYTQSKLLMQQIALNFSSINILYWQLHIDILNKITSIDPPLFDVRLMSDIYNVIIRATEQVSKEGIVIDLPYQNVKVKDGSSAYVNSKKSKYFIPSMAIENISQYYSLQGKYRVGNANKSKENFEFNSKLAQFMLIRDAIALEQILTGIDVGIRERHQYFSDNQTYSLTTSETPIDVMFGFIKLHIMHYFSLLSYKGLIKLGNLITLVKTNVEEPNESGKFDEMIKRNLKFIKKRSQYRKNRYKNLKVAKPAELGAVDFEKIQVERNSNIDANIAKIEEIPVEEIVDTEVDLDKGGEVIQDGSNNQMLELASRPVISMENYGKLIYHLATTFQQNILDQNRINSNRTVREYSELDPVRKENDPEVKLITALKAVKPNAIERLHISPDGRANLTRDIVDNLNKKYKKIN